MPSKYKYIFLSKKEDYGYAIDEFNHEHTLINCNAKFKKKYIEQHKGVSLYDTEGEYHILETPDKLEGNLIYYGGISCTIPAQSEHIVRKFMDIGD